MKTNELRSKHDTALFLSLSVCSIIIYAIFIWQLSVPVIAWFSFQKMDQKSLQTAAGFDRKNPSYHYLLGRYHHLNLENPDINKAVVSYKNSLSLSPLQPVAWIDLSKAHQTLGQTGEAEQALERAVRLSPNNPELMWEAGTFWLINNMTDKALEVLKKYILIQPDRQRTVYDLCHKLKLRNSYILENLIPDSYIFQSEYLRYLIGVKKTEESQEVWKRMEKENLDQDMFITYVNFLISNSLYENAYAVWKEMTDRREDLKNAEGEKGSLLWNYSFEQEVLNGGFDWRISEAEGVDVFIDDSIHMTGSRSLGVNFDGKHNPDIAIAQQIVRLAPGGRYTLKAYIRTESLSTTNGIYINMQGHNCSGLNRSSEVATGSNFWKEVSIDFEAPVECRAAAVKLRRDRSAKLDNKIEGSAWIDGITLKQQNIIQASSSKKH